MLATLIAIPILGFLVIIQSAILSRMPLLYGMPDLVMIGVIGWALQKRVNTAWQWGIIGSLLVNIASGVQFLIPWISYMFIIGFTLWLKERIIQLPLLVMLIATFLGTVLTHVLTLIALRLFGTAIPLLESFNIVTLPSLLLNLLVAIPIYAILGELAKWLYPEELET